MLRLLCAGRAVPPAWLLACLLQGLSLTLAEGESPRKHLRSRVFSLQASQKLEAATGQQCLPLSLDVRQPQTIVAAVEEALKKFERIDILVNGELLEWAGGTFGTGSLLGGVFPCVGLCLPSVCFGLGVSGQPREHGGLRGSTDLFVTRGHPCSHCTSTLLPSRCWAPGAKSC